MKKLFLFLITFLSIILNISCNKKTVDLSRSSITGKVRINSSFGIDKFSPQKTIITVGPENQTVYANESGDFSITSLESGTYYVIAYNDNFKARITNVVVDDGKDTEINVIMLPSGNLTTSISTKERSRLLNSSLILSNYGTFEPDEFGNFLVESIPAGIYNASIINPHCSKIIIPEIVIEPIKTTTLPCFYLSESNSNINKGWDELKSKNHERAYVFFQNVVETSSSILEIQEAYTGIAWTEFQRKNYSNAVIYFEKINEKSNDVKVILASIYLMNSSKVYIEKAYELLESVDNVYNYSCIVARNNIIIPVHKVISLKAICYFLVGEKEKLDLALKRLKTLPYDYRSYVTFTEFSQHIALIPHHQ